MCANFFTKHNLARLRIKDAPNIILFLILLLLIGQFNAITTHKRLDGIITLTEATI